VDNLIRFAADGMLLTIFFIAAIAGVYWLRHQTKKDIVRLAPIVIMAGMTSLLLGKLLSLVYQPDTARPFVEKGLEAGAAYINNPGFPSDHALLAVVLVSALWFVAQYKKLAVVLAVLVVVMCIARVLALVHTPLDVAGGIVLGLAGTVWYRARDAYA
jgi:membrane-associated phospholipid phosphatase